MPIYEFQCKKCGQKWELLISVEEYREDIRCEKCGGEMKRVYNTFAIHGLGYDMGYRPGVDDPVKEIKHDLKKLEESAMETGNLKKYHEKKKALKYFAEAHEDILK
jgi:putative FmdB family regulatory protein